MKRALGRWAQRPSGVAMTKWEVYRVRRQRAAASRRRSWQKRGHGRLAFVHHLAARREARSWRAPGARGGVNVLEISGGNSNDSDGEDGPVAARERVPVQLILASQLRHLPRSPKPHQYMYLYITCSRHASSTSIVLVHAQSNRCVPCFATSFEV